MLFGPNDGSKAPTDFGVTMECIQNCESEAEEACESGNIAIHAHHMCVLFFEQCLVLLLLFNKTQSFAVKKLP